jgi:hypothetical protein
MAAFNPLALGEKDYPERESKRHHETTMNHESL